MVPSLKRLLGIILFLLKGGMCMEYDTEKDIILKQLFEIRCDLKYLEKVKDEPNVAELMEQRLRGKLEEVKREYERLEKREKEKKEGR